MKHPGLTPHLLSATLFLFLSSTVDLTAQEMMTPGQAKAGSRSQELLKRYDKNGDGKLDDDERADAKEVMMKEQVDRQMTRAAAVPGNLERFRTEALAMFDKNKDGRLDDDERGTAQKFADTIQAAREGLDDMTKRFDKNSDGTLQPDEREQMDAYLGELRAMGAREIRDTLIRRFDRNANARIDDNEKEELEKFVRPRLETNQVQLRRYDKNTDGKLDDAEWDAARSTVLQWLNATTPMAFNTDGLREETDSARLQAIAKEVERRRAIRENAGQVLSTTSPTPEQEMARLKAVAAEVERRRAIRETATKDLGK